MPMLGPTSAVHRQTSAGACGCRLVATSTEIATHLLVLASSNHLPTPRSGALPGTPRGRKPFCPRKFRSHPRSVTWRSPARRGRRDRQIVDSGRFRILLATARNCDLANGDHTMDPILGRRADFHDFRTLETLTRKA